MKYIKTFEAKLTQKALIESIKSFLDKALPNNFTSKLNGSTLDIKETGQRKAPCYIYIELSNKLISINISCYTLKGSNINVMANYIKDKMKQSRIPVEVIYNRDDTNNYNEHNNLKIDINYYDEVIEFFNNLPTDELEIAMMAHKFNL